MERVPLVGYPRLGNLIPERRRSNVDETLILDAARSMVSLGLKDAGYNFVNLGARSGRVGLSSLIRGR